jgi:hypothetical protein
MAWADDAHSVVSVKQFPLGGRHAHDDDSHIRR